MKDEIKEILDRLDFNEWEVDLYKVPITWAELYDIRDYITNLQEKYERMKENAEILSNGYNDLEKRNEKAIEYINTHYLNANEPELLNILQGEDKDE